MDPATSMYLDQRKIVYLEGFRMEITALAKRIGSYLENCSDNLGMDQSEARTFYALIESLGILAGDIEVHMKSCGDCIIHMIRRGDLIPIEEWWKRNQGSK